MAISQQPPEISQVFGELLGAWAAQIWLESGSPQHVTLLECGPGRGTLMADALRATKNVPGFHAALDITLLEMSPFLQEKQHAALAGYDVRWIEHLSDLGGQRPVIILANEFLDALPVRHLVYEGGKWQERAVGLSDAGTLCFTVMPATDELLQLIPDNLPLSKVGDILEISPERAAFMVEVFALLKARSGASLFIDYGYTLPAYGESLQALYKHEFSPVLERVGEADLTAHVDFQALTRAGEAAGMQTYGPVDQGVFLKNLGIGVRSGALMKGATPAQAENIQKALQRLTHSDEMGTLFKAIGFTHGLTHRPPGF
ncbi:MAG: SAM-dependent methyltransferase [Alphaproteobacteria bacterium]|nr:SAM-dependent methyltransferase [Alphaproteobacteria bacterium]